MKLNSFIRPVVSVLAIVSTLSGAMACGVYFRTVPKPEFFLEDCDIDYQSLLEREENLRLWQSQTSDQIPLADIEQVVYKDSPEKIENIVLFGKNYAGNNMFYRYLKNSRTDITGFLWLAKASERLGEKRKSAWYYPAHRNSDTEAADYGEIIDRCKKKWSPELHDRLALQVERALFYSGDYKGCEEYFDSTFRDIPDSNLMKRMARRYTAGALRRMGKDQRADTLFALSGDVWSVSRNDKLEFTASLNPDAPQLLYYIRSNARDSASMADYSRLAESLLKSRKVKHRGDWEFVQAYYYYNFLYDVPRARKHINNAVRGTFSTDELADLAFLYRMKVNAAAGDVSSLYDDIRHADEMTDEMRDNVNAWLDRVQNVVYSDLIPALWKRGDYSTAIMLANYVNNRWINRYAGYDMFASRDYDNIDYGSLAVQMMQSMPSSQLIRTCALMSELTPVKDFLRPYQPASGDFYNELIGTVALCEGNYERAAEYLQRVDQAYVANMLIYDYMDRDPFSPYESRWSTEEYDYGGNKYTYDSESWMNPCIFVRRGANPKLSFAQAMIVLKREMASAPTADARGMARLRYAIGRRNSFENCWALTQYGRGNVPDIFDIYDYGYYKGGDIVMERYSFLRNYIEDKTYWKVEDEYKKEVEAALAMLTTDEARARAEFIFRNLKTVVQKYPNTRAALYVYTSCDNWRSWL